MVLSAAAIMGGLIGAGMSGAFSSREHARPRDVRFSCTVTRVHDGDGPIWCAEGPKVRLTAIPARELDETCQPGHPCPDASGAAARAELERLVGGQVLTCEKTGTSYHRVTAWCWRADGTELNCAMVKSGKAVVWPKFDPQGRLCHPGWQPK